jgi:CheY-like chemotaxis protein
MATKVLIIEDDKIMMSSTAMVLVETGGCDVVTAMGGPAGIEAAHREQPDLILLDIMMPDMDGWEVLKHIKADPITASIPGPDLHRLRGRPAEEAHAPQRHAGPRPQALRARGAGRYRAPDHADPVQ